MQKFSFVNIAELKQKVENSGLDEKIMELILRRRKQMIVHSIIYYRLNTSIISDLQFDTWGRELVKLQKEHPKESEKVKYYSDFKDWDASTGFNLYFPEFEATAQNLVLYHMKRLQDANSKI